MQHAAIRHWYLLLCIYIIFFKCSLLLSIPFLYFKKGIDKSTEWSTTPACPSPMCFFNRGNTEGTNSSKGLCLIFVYDLCKFVSGLIVWFLGNLWFDDLCEE